MSGALAGVAYIWIAQGIAFLLMPKAVDCSFRARALLFWAVTAPIILLVQPPFSMLLAVATLLFFFSPIAPITRTAFFIVAIPAVPVFVSAPLPFPGINYLTELTHYKLASLILLAPVLLAKRERATPVAGQTNTVGVALLVYVVYATMLMGVSYGFTPALRFALDQVLILIFPFFAILLTLRKPQDVDKFFQSFLIVSLLLAMVALVSSFKRWDIYAVGALFGAEVRGGMLRINATAGTHSLAFHLAGALVILEYLKIRFQIGRTFLNLMRAILLAGMLTTDSRGALGGLIVAWCAYNMLILRSNAIRAALLLAITTGVFGGAIWLAQGKVDAYDPHGTFSYRQVLLWTSIDYISRYPLFGDRNFMQSGLFDHLLQGQGIIDITNLYLQVALTFGLLGLMLFASVFVFPFLKAGVVVLRMSQSRPHMAGNDKAHLGSDNEIWFLATAVTVSIGAGWLFLIVTTSDVGLTLHIGVVFAAICYALLRMRPVAQTQTAAGSKVQGTQSPGLPR